jgi:hypothetical protein
MWSIWERQNSYFKAIILHDIPLKIQPILSVFKIYDENSSKIYEKEGELTITIIDNELKVTRDCSRGIKIDGLDGGL